MSKEYRFYFGKKFYKDKDGYWKPTGSPYMWAHRWVWLQIYGEIPKGMDVHHIDEDKSNNEIKNLKILTRSEHLKEHWKDSEDRKKRREFLDKMRPLSRAHLYTEEGKKRRIDLIKKGWKSRKTQIIVCKECGKDKHTKCFNAKFCCHNCYMRNRRKLLKK